MRLAGKSLVNLISPKVVNVLKSSALVKASDGRGAFPGERKAYQQDETSCHCKFPKVPTNREFP